MSFLIANWEKLIFVNYQVDPNILRPYLPTGLELDDHNGTYYLSFVTMRFDNTRVKNIPFPFHKRFEEVNLRFYVKRKSIDGSWRKGVVFISEIVPKPLITFVARMLYNESYQTMKLSHRWIRTHDLQDISYSIHKDHKKNTISIETNSESKSIAPNSLQDFIIERYFGYTKNHKGKTIEYQVIHKPWKTHTITKTEIDIDFKNIYGDTFSFLDTMDPDSIFFTEGSITSVENKRVVY